MERNQRDSAPARYANVVEARAPISAIVRLHLVQLASDQPRSARLQDVSQSDSSARFPSGVSPFDPVAVDD